MSEVLFQCRCGWVAVESELAKTDGYCPTCKSGRPDMVAKYDSGKMMKRGA